MLEMERVVYRSILQDSADMFAIDMHEHELSQSFSPSRFDENQFQKNMIECLTPENRSATIGWKKIEPEMVSPLDQCRLSVSE